VKRVRKKCAAITIESTKATNTSTRNTIDIGMKVARLTLWVIEITLTILSDAESIAVRRSINTRSTTSLAEGEVLSRQGHPTPDLDLMRE